MKLAWKRLEGADGHTVGRELLRELVGILPKLAMTERGKPYFPEDGPHFSISHTKNHVFCCVSTRNVGIDAEETDREIDLRLAERILSDAEKRRFDASADKNTTLLRLWVLKESYAKLTGRGWGSYLYKTDFDPNDPRIQIIDGCFVAIMEEE